jgi:hypothetical protein
MACMHRCYGHTLVVLGFTPPGLPRTGIPCPRSLENVEGGGLHIHLHLFCSHTSSAHKIMLSALIYGLVITSTHI